MNDPAFRTLQQEIARELEVAETFEAEAEIERRVVFLAERLTSTGLSSLVLGISGGVDSTTARPPVAGSRSGAPATPGTRHGSTRCGCPTASRPTSTMPGSRSPSSSPITC